MKVSVLLDSGSTHNFLQEEVARKLRLPITPIPSFLVSTGSGVSLRCDKMCKLVKMTVQGVTMTINMFVLNMEGANLVLGIQWFKIVGSILSNYTGMNIEFNWNGERIKWMGESILSDEQLSKNEMNSLATTTAGAFFCRFEYVGELKEEEQKKFSNSEIQEGELNPILNEFCDVFTEPTGLPPARSQFYNITLENLADLVSVRPYRQAQFQKDEIERIVQEMLRQQIIRESSNPYSSPVLLVKKRW